MRFVTIALVTLAVSAVAGRGFAQACPPPSDRGQVNRYLLDTALVRPRTGGDPSRQVLVYTPPGYDDPANADRRYPVLYLLHGMPGNPDNFLTYGRWQEMLERQAARSGRDAPILVMPDGRYAGQKEGDSEWVNSFDGRDRFEDWIVREVVPWSDSRFRTKSGASEHVIAGVSSGAYGAVNIALHHPDVFGVVLALSGYYTNDGSGWARPIMGRDPAYLRANSPLSVVSDAVETSRAPSTWKTLRFFLGAGSDEKAYADDASALADKMTTVGASVTLLLRKGKHGWDLWNALFRAGATYLLPGAGPDKTGAIPGGGTDGSSPSASSSAVCSGSGR